MSETNATVVLVHGAWHGSWCWERVVPLLQNRGLAVRAVDLPSVGVAPGVAVDLSADAAAVEAVIREIGGPVVLCGHSYGGMVISRVVPTNVRRLVYLCAFMPAEGESIVSLGGGQHIPWMRVLEGSLTIPDMAQADATFYGDCDAQVRERAKSRLRVQSGAPFKEPVLSPSWRKVPSTYVVCANDMAILANVQRSLFAPRATEVVELNTSHSPFYSSPETVADILATRAA